MNIKNTLIPGAIASLILVPAIAHAGLILDSGTPTGSASYQLDSTQWFAAEFNATAGETVNDFAAYLTQGLGQPGNTFTFDVFNASGFTSTRVSGTSLTPATAVYSATGTFTANGWNSAAANWAVGTTGSYWVVLEVASASQSPGLDLTGETSATTGTAPASAFAYYGSGTNGKFTTSGAPAFGVQISAVPLPPTLWLLGGGLLGFGALARRRRS